MHSMDSTARPTVTGKSHRHRHQTIFNHSSSCLLHCRYSPQSRDNCLLCDRAMSHIDYYADVQPDRDYDIYSMSDDSNSCGRQPPTNRKDNAREWTNQSLPFFQFLFQFMFLPHSECFFRAIENSRFFSSIVRDSLTVKSIGECEMECIKSSKFTCRAFTYRYVFLPFELDRAFLSLC